jgi:hypothetical protein
MWKKREGGSEDRRSRIDDRRLRFSIFHSQSSIVNLEVYDA